MASSRMASLWVALPLAMAMACYVQVAVGVRYHIRDISDRIGNGTIQLELDTGGYLTGKDAKQLGVTQDPKDPISFWTIETLLIGFLDNSVYIYNNHYDRYVTYDAGIAFIKPESVKLQGFADPVFSRWWFEEADETGWYKIQSTLVLNIFDPYFISFNGENNQKGSTAFRIVPLNPPTPRPPPTGVFIQALAFEHVYLRVDASQWSDDFRGKQVTLQYDLDNSNRFELVALQGEGNDVYAIRSEQYSLYISLDSTEFPWQVPTDGCSGHPDGLGSSRAIPEIDDTTKFKLIVNLDETTNPVLSYSFKLLHPKEPSVRPDIYLRFDGRGITQGSRGGLVNGQTFIGDFEKFKIERF